MNMTAAVITIFSLSFASNALAVIPALTCSSNDRFFWVRHVRADEYSIDIVGSLRRFPVRKRPFNIPGSSPSIKAANFIAADGNVLATLTVEDNGRITGTVLTYPVSCLKERI